MPPLTERFEMRLDQGILEEIDEWRGNQSGLLTRSEAIRQLVQAALSAEKDKPIQLTDGEKLILFMLSDLSKHQKVKGGIDPEFVEDVIGGGHYWGLGWKYTGVFHDHVDRKADVSEVVNVLEMWSFLERSHAGLSAENKSKVEAAVHPFGKSVRFPGFDGNNETDLIGIARFLIEKLERFADFEDRDLNSHMPVIESYRRMLAIFEPLRVKLTGRNLNADEIISVLSERVHPERRG